MKLVSLYLLLMTILINANAVEISQTTRVYDVPLKYTDNYASMIREGKLVQSDTKVINDQNVFQHKDLIIIFPGNSRYSNMNLLLDAVKSYSRELDNIDSEKVDRILNLLKTESSGSAR